MNNFLEKEYKDASCGLWGTRGILVFAIGLVMLMAGAPSTARASLVNSSTISTAGGDTLKTGLVGWWTFDGANLKNNATDSSGLGNHGYLTGFGATSTAVTTGKIGQGLKFDGVNDYVDAGSGASLNLTSNFTISVWIYPIFSGAASNEYVLAKRSDVGNGFNILTNLVSPVVQIVDGAGTIIGSDVRMDYRKWQHVVIIVDNLGTHFTVYKNGVASYPISMTPFANIPTQKLFIGSRNGGVLPFLGSLDDVRIYNRALSASEIKQLYNLASEKINATPTATAGGDTLKTSLVGWWTFDGKDTSWTSATAATTLDKSGNNNTGTLTYMSRSTSPVAGKIGQAFNFDGVNDYVDTGKTLTNLGIDYNRPFSVSMWMRPKVFPVVGLIQKFIAVQLRADANGGNLIRRGFYGQVDAYGNAYFRLCQDNTVSKAWSWYTGNGTVSLNKWYHIVLTYDGNNTSTSGKTYANGVLKSSTGDGNAMDASVETNYSLYIGAEDYPQYPGVAPGSNVDQWFNGSMDDVRIYNRVLSTSEIKQLYNLGSEKINATPTATGGGDTLKTGLAGWWTFDGANMKNNVTDSSGGGNHGYLTGFGATSTAVTAGKLGQGLRFDGVNDYVKFPNCGVGPRVDGATAISTSVWIYPYDVSGNYLINYIGLGDNKSASSLTITTNALGIQGRSVNTDSLQGMTQNSTISARKWTHVVGISDYTAKTFSIYINGVLNKSGGTTFGNNTFTFGTCDSGIVDATGSSPTPDRFFKGVIDDVRVYSRALSASEIKQLYNLGR